MALPNTISTDIDIGSTSGTAGVSYVGPFKSAGGDYYMFARNDADKSILEAWKATDPESTWTEQDISNSPEKTTIIEAIWCYPVGDKIHVIVSNLDDVKYSRYNMADDTWDTITGSVKIVAIETTVDISSSGTIVVASDGDIYVGYNGADEKFMGTNEARVYWDKSTDSGATWAGATHLRTTSSAVDHANVTAVLGASDRIHYIWSFGIEIGGSHNVNHRSLSSADSLDTEQTADSTASISTPRVGRGDVYTDGSNQNIRVPYVDANGKAAVVQFNSGATPTLNLETDASDDIIFNTLICLASRNATDKETWLSYVRTSDRDLFVDKNTDGAGWGTDIEVHDAVTLASNVSCNVITNEAGDLVLGMIIKDNALTNDPVQYTEHVIEAAAPAVRRMAVIGG